MGTHLNKLNLKETWGLSLLLFLMHYNQMHKSTIPCTTLSYMLPILDNIHNFLYFCPQFRYKNSAINNWFWNYQISRRKLLLTLKSKSGRLVINSNHNRAVVTDFIHNFSFLCYARLAIENVSFFLVFCYNAFYYWLDWKR